MDTRASVFIRVQKVLDTSIAYLQERQQICSRSFYVTE